MQVMQESGDKIWVRFQYRLLQPYKCRLVHSAEEATLYIYMPFKYKEHFLLFQWAAGLAEDPSIHMGRITRDQLKEKALNTERPNSLPQATKEQ